MTDNEIVVKVTAHLVKWMVDKRMTPTQRRLAVEFMNEFTRKYNEERAKAEEANNVS